VRRAAHGGSAMRRGRANTLGEQSPRPAGRRLVSAKLIIMHSGDILNNAQLIEAIGFYQISIVKIAPHLRAKYRGF
jgi:hypothetical protein